MVRRTNHLQGDLFLGRRWILGDSLEGEETTSETTDQGLRFHVKAIKHDQPGNLRSEETTQNESVELVRRLGVNHDHDVLPAVKVPEGAGGMVAG
jgi:hypothetical protein